MKINISTSNRRDYEFLLANYGEFLQGYGLEQTEDGGAAVHLDSLGSLFLFEQGLARFTEPMDSSYFGLQAGSEYGKPFLAIMDQY